MKNFKLISTPLAADFKFNSQQSPSREKEMEKIMSVPYACVVTNLMCSLVCTRSNIAHVVGVINRFLVNPDKEH